MKKLGWIVVAIMLIIITNLFFYKESYDTNCKIDHEKFAAWGTMVGSLLTAITVFLLYRQNQQQLEATNAAIHPDIFPLGGVFETFNRFKTDKDKNTYPLFHIALPDNATDEDEYYAEIDADWNIRCKVFNLGLSVAKNVSYKWEFEKQKIDKLLSGTYLVANDNKLKEHITEEEKYQQAIFIPKGAKSTLTLPMYYCRSLGKDVNIKYPETKKPELLLRITYYNIYGVKIVKKFKTLFECHGHRIEISFNQIPL